MPDVGSVGRRPVLDDDRLDVRVLPAQIAEETLRGVPLAVVLRGSVLIPDRLRRQWEHLLQVGVDHRRESGPQARNHRRSAPYPSTSAGLPRAGPPAQFHKDPWLPLQALVWQHRNEGREHLPGP